MIPGSPGAPGPPAIDWAAWRREFPILDHSVYLVNHSLGAMPRAAYADLRAFGDDWAGRGVRAWEEGWWELPLALGNLIARIIGGPPGSVVMTPNVTTAMEAIVSCFDWRGPRDAIVTTDVDFPSVLYLLERQTRRGARLVRVPSADGLSFEMEALLSAIDERTRLVVISHVLFKSARIVDVAAVARRARQVGALVVLDAYQSVGTVPVDVRAFDVDFLVGGSVKWLCGGPGAGYLYVKPELADTLEPAFTGWAGHENPFAFDPGPTRYRPGVGRFLNGTPHVPCLYAARAGYAIVLEIGVPAIRGRSLALTRRLLDRADAEGYPVRSARADDERGGTVSLDVPHAHAVARALISREFIVDFRPGAGIRMGPHFYNTDEEVDALVAEIRNILAAGSWKEFAAAEDAP